MNLSFAVMVSVDKRQVFSLYLPGITQVAFTGISLAELLDDVALHLMEKLPGESIGRLPVYQFCTDIDLIRVRVTIEQTQEPGRKKPTWSGRFAVVVKRWPDEPYHIATVPTLSTDTFAVRNLNALAAGLTHHIQKVYEDSGLAPLEAAVCQSAEYLEILEVDADLPSILPSRPKRKKKKKKKKKKRNKNKKKGKKDPETEEEREKRRMVPPITLREVGHNLTHRAIDGRLSRTYGRDPLVAQLTKQLQRPGAAILLVGPPGVGKTAIVQAIVQGHADRKLPLKDRTDFWAVDGNRIIAGMSVVGAWEQRVGNMVEELAARLDVLYVNDLPALVYAGRSAHGDSNVAEYLEPHIARGEIRIIGECTSERLEATREEAPGFFSRFHIVHVDALTERDTLSVLVAARRDLERDEELTVEMPTLETVLALTRRFQPGRAHPGKAVSLLRRLVSDFTHEERDDIGRRRVTRDMLVDFFARQTGLPRFVLWEGQARSFESIHNHFLKRIIAQAAASHAAASVVTVLQQGLNDPDKPLATMLFVGPTGVGKTETAKAIAEYLFGSKERLIRFDMSEFRDPLSSARLFGDRFRPEGELTRRVRETPFAVVLFDEIEKADPSVFDAFLQVFGEGRLTNAAGYTTNFCNTVLIMTSNLGVKGAQSNLGFAQPSGDQQDTHYRKAAEGFFRPELFNRIDSIVAFRRLGRDAIRPLVERVLLEVLGRRGLRRSGVVVDVEPELVELLVDQGFDPRYGARSLRRVLEQRLVVPLARQIVTKPVDRTTIVQLFRHGGDIGMDVWALEDRERLATTPETLPDWPTLEARYNALKHELETLAQSPLYVRLVGQHTELLAAVNAGTIDGSQWALFHSASALIERHRSLLRQLGDFYEQNLAAYDFVEELHIVGFGRQDQYQTNMAARRTTPRVVGTEIPLPLERDLLFRGATEAFVDLELEYAVLAFRVAAVQRPEETARVRLLSVTAEPSSRVWLARLTRSLRDLWRGWGEVRGYCCREGRWEEMPGEPAEDDEHLSGFALDLRGYGITEVLRDELGFHVDSSLHGADLVLDIARVEDVGREGDAIEHLTRLDAEYAHFKEARRQGQEVSHPRPELPVARRFESAEHADVDAALDDVFLTTLRVQLYYGHTS